MPIILKNKWQGLKEGSKGRQMEDAGVINQNRKIHREMEIGHQKPGIAGEEQPK